MCGIVGVFSEGPPVERRRLRKALHSMQKRGPDDQGEWWSEDGRIGIGHRRLAITRPLSGNQPVVSEHCTVTVNGEFYGLDAEFDARSDSWALPTLYRRYGLSGALDRLRGEFALLLYDHLQKKLFIVRDRFGIKPLFWARRGPEWWFASKPSALWSAGISAGWCESSFLQAAHTQYPAPGRSMFQGIRTVRPGHFLTLSEGLTETRYWQAPRTTEPVSSETFLNQLRGCVHARVRKGAPSAVLLSGGVDSAAVSALASETNQDIRAYTVDFPHQGSFSEGPKAALQAEHCGLSHRIIPLTGDEILRDLAEAVGQSEGLCVNGHLVAKMKLAEAVAQDGRQVLLTGEGADELLFGYRHFSRYFGEVADPLADPAGLGILTTTTREELPQSYPAFFHSKLALGRRICELLGLQHIPSPAFQKLIDSNESADPLDSARQAWLDTALSSYILEVLGDGTEMSHSLEGRPPFLDHTLWELAIRPSSTDKGLLRDALGGGVVHEILASTKHPFMAAPLGDDLIARLRHEVLEQRHPFLDRDSALHVLARVQTLEKHERLEWEPAMIWVLSSFYLQRIFGEFSS